MKATTAYQLRLALVALKNGITVKVNVRGVGAYKVSAIRNLNHTLMLTIDGGGYLAVDPDDILTVWVPELPPAFQEANLHAE